VQNTTDSVPAFSPTYLAPSVPDSRGASGCLHPSTKSSGRNLPQPDGTLLPAAQVDLINLYELRWQVPFITDCRSIPISSKLNLLLAKFLERRRRDVYPAISKSKIPFRASVTRALPQEIFYCKRPFNDVLGPDSSDPRYCFGGILSSSMKQSSKTTKSPHHDIFPKRPILTSTQLQFC